mmetsp:Transcript_31010/g.34582  ORF Transcript_31010/g.34582 Transcript_31010/m.34582 type:complete len:232 (+) Transcript_31010:22-717(+)
MAERNHHSCRDDHHEHHGHSHGEHSHGHGHSHGGDGDHDHDSPYRGAEFSLYRRIHLDSVICYNEETNGSGKTVFKSWDDRLDRTKFVVSDADEELLFYIPFTGEVKLKSICVIGGGGDQSPSKLSAFINNDQLDFDSVEDTKPLQTWDLNQDGTGALEYPTQMAKFARVRSLTLHFSANFGAEVTKILYIGLKGEYREFKRQAVNVTYELRPNPADNKNVNIDATGRAVQ